MTDRLKETISARVAPALRELLNAEAQEMDITPSHLFEKILRGRYEGLEEKVNNLHFTTEKLENSAKSDFQQIDNLEQLVKDQYTDIRAAEAAKEEITLQLEEREEQIESLSQRLQDLEEQPSIDFEDRVLEIENYFNKLALIYPNYAKSDLVAFALKVALQAEKSVFAVPISHVSDL